jgi:ATP-dependent Lon protease
LRSLRNDDYSTRYKDLFTLSNEISTRDRAAINKTFSGLMKILFPHDEATVAEIEYVLKFAIEGRKRVKDQLMRIDTTYADTKFYYEDNEGKKYWVTTLEEDEYPHYYHRTISDGTEEDIDEPVPVPSTPSVSMTTTEKEDDTSDKNEPKEQHLSFQENQKGISYDLLFSDYFKGATKITITDPYIRMFFQVRNIMELMETIINNKPIEDEVVVHLITIANDRDPEQQIESFTEIQNSVQAAGISFTWEFDPTETIHARHIVTDTGWKISLDRGLDIFQQYAMNDAFSLSNKMQKFRGCKGFEVTYIKVDREG